ncbi:MAG TPA: hypothetical protein PKI55_04160 [Chitinophagaceae bacterium]|nr:hypothetical protein [Chitinophagaceae bacterium]
MANKSGLDNLLKSVLSVGNAEQNFSYPPHVFSNHINIVTSFILDNLAIIYPKYADALLPFIGKKLIPVTDGYVQLPDDYRNLLGAPSVQVKNGKDCNDPVVIDTASEFKTAKLKAGCQSVPIIIVDKGQWDDRTTSTYAYPRIDSPIGMFDSGKKIKVCPYDIARVEVLYVKKEKIYRYGYISQPDDTYIYDAATSEESEWEEPAFELLFKGIFALYSAWSRDSTIIEYSTILNKAGLF